MSVQISAVRDGASAAVNRIVFNSRGLSVDPSTGNVRQVNVVLTGQSGVTRTVQVGTMGGVTVQ